jgi:hypothetical protein
MRPPPAYIISKTRFCSASNTQNTHLSIVIIYQTARHHTGYRTEPGFVGFSSVRRITMRMSAQTIAKIRQDYNECVLIVDWS